MNTIIDSTVLLDIYKFNTCIKYINSNVRYILNPHFFLQNYKHYTNITYHISRTNHEFFV